MPSFVHRVAILLYGLSISTLRLPPALGPSNAPVAPNEMVLQGSQPHNLNLQRFKVLCICRNYSSVLSRLYWNANCRTLTSAEPSRLSAHDHSLRDPSTPLSLSSVTTCYTRLPQGMVEYVSQGLHDDAKEAAVLLYSPRTDTFLEDMTRNADRVIYFDEGRELRLGSHLNFMILFGSAGGRWSKIRTGIDFDTHSFI